MSDIRLEHVPLYLHRELRLEAAAKTLSVRGLVLDILRRHVERRKTLEEQAKKSIEEAPR